MGVEHRTVQVREGALRGRRSGKGFAFLGIPYAAPPVGPLRWRPPLPAARWTGTRDAFAFGPDPLQPPVATLRGPRQDEDCLFLNVWTPSPEAGTAWPVLVWLPGGGFVGGSGSEPQNDGAALAAAGAVVVTVNYRCGLFGYLAHPALSAESPAGVSGNYGLLDQIAALRWVRENIAAFGGDPRRITAFGYSAGAASIALLLAAPQGAGLFDRAILQSPGAARPLASLADAEAAGRALGDELDALRALSGPQVLERTGLLMPRVRGLTTPRVLRPIRDGWLLPQDDGAAFRQRRQHALPVLVGSNADEGTQLTKAWPVDSVAAWREQVQGNFSAMAEEAAALYPVHGDAGARPAVAAMFADTQFNYGTRLVAQAMAAVEPRTWRYVFLRRRPGEPDGPHHGAEVPYAFGNLTAGAGEEDEALSRAMQRAWVAFAASGDPNAPGVPHWDAYRAQADNYLGLDAAPRMDAAWRLPQLQFLDRFFGR